MIRLRTPSFFQPWRHFPADTRPHPPQLGRWIQVERVRMLQIGLPTARVARAGSNSAFASSSAVTSVPFLSRTEAHPSWRSRLDPNPHRSDCQAGTAHDDVELVQPVPGGKNRPQWNLTLCQDQMTRRLVASILWSSGCKYVSPGRAWSSKRRCATS